MRLLGAVRRGIVVEKGHPESAGLRTGVERRPSVLVIDDESLLGQTLQLGLEDSLDVTLELSGKRGLGRLLAHEAFDLVLCDLSLPDLTGVEIHQRVMAVRPELSPRFVVMTGGAVTETARAFLESYRGPLLQKPFTLSEVEALAARLLSQPLSVR